MPLVKLAGFDEAVRRHTWKGSRELVPVVAGPRPCTRCSVGHVVQLDPVVQPALFYDGGYGAAEKTTIEICLACRRTAVVQLETVNPRKLGET